MKYIDAHIIASKISRNFSERRICYPNVLKNIGIRDDEKKSK